MKNKEDPDLKRSTIIFLTLLIAALYSFSISEPFQIFVHVLDKNTKEPIPFASVQISGDTSVTTVTDTSGKAMFVAKPGNYNFHVTAVGYEPGNLNAIATDVNKNFTIELINGIRLNEVIIGASAGAINIRGSRSDATSYYIDGIRVSGTPGVSTLSYSEIAALPTRDINSMAAGSPGKTHPSKNTFENKLTAGEINDFAKWKLWEDESRDILESYSDNFGIKASQRFCIQLTDERGWPVTDAEVHLIDDGNELSFVHSDNTGKAECWTNKNASKNNSDLYVRVISGGKSFILKSPHSFEQGINSFRIKHDCNVSDTLDIAFIVDATGSMSDEINYLKAEMTGLVQNIKTKNKNLVVRIASLFYRDEGDEYLVRYADFSTNLESVRDYISNQNAGGGGDTPEGLDTALATIGNLNWSSNARARIGFLIADAPPHNEAGNKNTLKNAINVAMNKGIRIVPIACSGADKSTEYLMRNLALLSNGSYLYLTNHSGVGGGHIDPTTDKLDHKKLNALLLSVIKRFTQTPGCPDTEIIPEKDSTVTTNAVTDTTKQIEDDIQQSITDNKKKTDENVKISPNPTSGIVTVSAIENILEIQLYDINGKALQKFKSSNESEELDLTMFPVGQYILKVIREKNNSYLKLLIAR
jgi:hypothetical protein